MRWAAVLGAASLLMVGVAEARDEIRVVGSAAALLFTHTVAEHFAQRSSFAAPSLELTGAALGFREFCAGVGFEHPDVNVTSRRITTGEFSDCQEHGVTSISEIEVGQEVLLLVNAESGPPLAITTGELFTAVAGELPLDGRLQENPHQKWSDIRKTLPNLAIQVISPPPRSPTYDAFMALVMERGCQSLSSVQQLDADRQVQVCRTLRQDGAYLSRMRDEQDMLQWLRANPSAYGIVNYPWWHDEGEGLLRANPVNGVPPSKQHLTSGGYPLARPLVLYVKNQHIGPVPGLQEFLYEFTAERTIGPDGYLAEEGFVPLDELARNRARDRALSLQPMSRE